MSTGIVIAIIVAVIVVVAALVIGGMAVLRRRRLQQRPGPEYDRTEGRTDQVTGEVKQAADKVGDAFKH